MILKQWKLGILEQSMNSPDENKLNFTKNWQIENETLRESRVGSIQKFEELKREQEFRLEEFSIRKLVEIYF